MPLCETLTENPDSVSAWVELAEAWTAEEGPCAALLRALPPAADAPDLGARAAAEALSRGAAGKLRARAHLALARHAAAYRCTEEDEDGHIVATVCGDDALAARHARLAMTYDVALGPDAVSYIHDDSLRRSGACPERAGGPVVNLSDPVRMCSAHGGRAVLIPTSLGACVGYPEDCLGIPREPLPTLPPDPTAMTVRDEEPASPFPTPLVCVEPLAVELRDETGDGVSDVWVLRAEGMCAFANGGRAMASQGRSVLLILDGATGDVLLEGAVGLWMRTWDTGGNTAPIDAVVWRAALTRGGPGELTLALTEVSGSESEQGTLVRADSTLLLPGRYRYLAGAFRWVE